jgi:hypothetical protein
MATISKLTPKTLKKIIKEEKIKLLKQLISEKKNRENQKKYYKLIKKVTNEERKVALKFKKLFEVKKFLKKRLRE